MTVEKIKRTSITRSERPPSPSYLSSRIDIDTQGLVQAGRESKERIFEYALRRFESIVPRPLTLDASARSAVEQHAKLQRLVAELAEANAALDETLAQPAPPPPDQLEALTAERLRRKLRVDNLRRRLRQRALVEEGRAGNGHPGAPRPSLAPSPSPSRRLDRTSQAHRTEPRRDARDVDDENGEAGPVRRVRQRAE